MRKVKNGMILFLIVLFCSVYLSSCRAIEAQNIKLDNNSNWNGSQVHDDSHTGGGIQLPNNGPGMNSFEKNRGE